MDAKILDGNKFSFVCILKFMSHIQWLPVFLSLHLEGVLQPVEQLMGELTHILLLSKAQTEHTKWPITQLPIGT